MFEDAGSVVDPLDDVCGELHEQSLQEQWVREWVAQHERELDCEGGGSDVPSVGVGGPPSAEELDGFVASILEVDPGAWATSALVTRVGPQPLERLPDGTSRWTSPSGRRYDVPRRPVLDDP